MKLKENIKRAIIAAFAAVFAFVAPAEELLVNCDYNSSTEGWGVTKFANYNSAYAYATANGKTSATIVIEKATSISGNCFDNNHKNYSRLAVVIKDGGLMGNAASKWDMTYPVTVEPGGKLTCARSKDSSVSYIHIKNTLTVGAQGATKKAVVDFLSDAYADCDISIRYNGKIVAYNAEIKVQDLDAQGALTLEGCDVLVDGAFASATSAFFSTTLTDTTMTVNGNQVPGGISDFAGGEANQLGNVKLNNSSLTIKDGETKVAANVTATGSSIDVANLTVNSGKTLNLNEGSTLNMDEFTLKGTAAVKVDGNKAEFTNPGDGFAMVVAKIGETPYTTLEEAFAAATEGQTITLLMDATPALTSQRAITKAAVVDLGGKTLTLTEDDLYFGTTTFQNGNIVVDPSVNASTAVFWMFEGQTITFNNVKLTATGVTGTYLIGINGGINTAVNLIESEIVIDNDSTVGLSAVICDNGTDNNVVISNSTINVKGIEGRFYLGGSKGDIAVTDSTVDLNGVKEGFYLRAGQFLDIAGNSTVNIVLNSTDGRHGINVTDLTATYTKADTATVNASVFEPPFVAKIGSAKYASLQTAINAVKNGETITLVADCAENVTATEKVGLYYTIDGAGKTMTGSIAITALSDTNDNRRITIKNFNFVDTTDAEVSFISAGASNYYPRFTVEGCSFTGSGDAKDVAVRVKDGNAVVIKDCTGTGLHSFLQNTAGWNLAIENVEVTNSKSGLALGTVQGVTISGCNIDVDGYGIRMDANTYNNNAVIANNTVKAFIPVVVRKVNTASSITFNGENTMTAKNTDGLWFAAGTSEYEENGKMPTDHTGKVVVTLNDTGLNASGVYGNYGVALVNGVKYVTLKDAVAAVADGGIITLIGNVTITEATRTHNSGSWYDGIYYVGDKSFTIDLGGFTVTHDGAVNDYLLNFKNDGAKANTITLKNGTIDAGTAAFCAICTSSASTQKITINTENINIINNNSNGSAVKIRGGAEFNAKAGTKITGKNSYLGIECVASTVNIYDGAEIYMNGTGSYNGCLVGACGGGVVNVYGGYGKGVKGGFIAMTSGGTINVSGGEWIANDDGTVGNDSNFYVLTAQNNKNESGYVGASVINVAGGTFRGGMDAWVLNDANVEKAELNIAGGNFNANPTVYLDEGYVVNEVSGVYTVAKAVAQIGDKPYTTIAAAIAAAKDGDTVTILAGEYGPIDIRNKNITLQGTVGANGELLTVIKGGNPAIIGHGFNGTIKDIKVVDAFKVMYAEPAGNVTVDNVSVTGATYGFHLIAYSTGLTWTIQNSYMDLSWANSFGVSGAGDAAIVIKGNEFASTNPYYPDYGAIPVNTFLPNITVEENVFGENTKIKLAAAFTDTSKINISKNYHADGVENAFADDSVVNVSIRQYYTDSELQNLVELLKGAGTEADPFVVASLADLKFFRDEVNGGNTFDNQFVKMTADIDLNNVAWAPIGNATTKFLGTFDGNGKTISNLVVETNTNNAGLFGFASVIKNLTINNAKVTGIVCVGAMVGELESSVGTLDNCHVTGHIEVTGENSVGGLAGKGYANIKDSSVIGDGVETSFVLGVYGTTEEGDNVGGLIGHLGEGNTLGVANSTVKNIKVAGTRKIGGLVGTTARGNDYVGNTVENVTVESTATADYANANASTCTIGGIIGNYFGSATSGGILNDSTVKNVTFVLGNAKSAGALVGGDRTNNGGAPVGVEATGSVVQNVTGATVAHFLVAQIDNTAYETLEAAVAAANTGDTVKVFAGTYAVPSMKAGITIEGAVNADGTPAVLFEGTLSGTLENLTMKNIHIKGGNAQRWAYAKGDLNFENVIFEATSVYALHFDGIAAGTNLKYKNCTIIGWAAMGGSPASCVFEGCTIKDNGRYGLIRTYFDTEIKNCTFDVANANTTDAYEDGIHAVEGAEITVTGCTNVNGDMKDLVNVHANSVVILDGVAIKNVAKIGDKYYSTLADALAAAQAGDTVKVFAGTYPVPAMKAGITIEGAVNADGTPAVLFEGTLTGTLENLTMKNIHIRGGNAQRWAYAKGDLNFENVTFEATSVYALHFDGIAAGTNLKYTDCTIIGWAAMGGSPESCVFEGCTIKDNGRYGLIRTYFDTEIKDCIFDVANANTTDAYEDGIHAVEGAEITVTGCTNKNGEMKDIVNVHANSVVTLDGVAIKNVAKIGDKYYTTISAAIEEAQNGDEIKLISDVTVDNAITISEGKEIVIDLNGCDIVGKQNCIKNNGTLTVKDSVGTANVYTTDVSAQGRATIVNNGTLTISGGWFGDSNNDMTDRNAINRGNALKNYGTATINGGYFTNVSNQYIGTDAYAYAINTLNGGTTIINNATVYGDINGLIFSDGTTIVNNGSFTLGRPNEENNLWYLAYGNVEIKGGTWTRAFKVPSWNTGDPKFMGDVAVSGGIFNVDVPEQYRATGYVSKLQADGTYVIIDDPTTHYIGTLDELIAFRDAVNSGTTFEGVTVYLTADIDMAGVNWVGIGSATADHGFMGNFDGKGFKIKNLTINNPALDSDGYAYAGFFSVTEGTATAQNVIKNLTIENVTINTTGHIVAAAIAYPYYTTVENVNVCGNISISGGNYTAGALAYTRRCVNASNVSVVGNDGSTITGAQTVGGVISDIQMNGGLTANYSNFKAENLTITGTKQVGGISGIISLQTLNGANVKNVTLVCDDARVGQVAGSLGGTSTISNIVVENVTGATAVIGGAYDGGAAVQAEIGDTFYTTFAAAYAAAQAGDTITLLADMTASDIIVLDKAITLDGNGKTLTSTAGRAINVSGADGVTIKNLTIDAKGERAINVIQGATNVTIDNVTATAANYTVNVASSAPNAVVAIKNSTLNGLCTVNVAAAGADVTVDNSTVNCNDNNTTAGESYAALNLNKEAVGGKIVATNTTVNVTEGSDSTKGRNSAENGIVTINGSTEGITETVAVITYAGSSNYYGFTTLADAIEFAKAGDTITLLRDVTASEIITINKAITLDGNGKTLTSTAGRAINVATEGDVTIKNLTVNCSGERGINVITKPANLTIEKCNITADNYAVNVATSAGAAQVAITGSTLTGLNVVNVAGAGADVTIATSTINSALNTTAEKYAALCLNMAARGATISVDGATEINVGSTSEIARNGAEDGSIKINGVEVGSVVVAVIEYGNNYNSYAAIADAIAAATSGETIKLLRDVTLTDTVTVAGKSITLDLNGKTVSASKTSAAYSALIHVLNGAALSVKDGGTNGKIVYDSASVSGAQGAIIWNEGDFVLESGTLETLGTWAIGYAVDVRPNAWGSDYADKNVTFVMNGGLVKTSDAAIRVAQNSSDAYTGYTASFTMNGGEINSAATGIFIQQFTDKYDDLAVTIAGGSITGSTAPIRFHGVEATGFVNGENGSSLTITGGTIAAGTGSGYVWLAEDLIRVSGDASLEAQMEVADIIVSETFAQNATLTEGYEWVDNGDGTFSMAVCNYVAQIGETKYTSLQAAIDAAVDGDMITVVADVMLTETLTIPEGKTITLDLNGKTISMVQSQTVGKNHEMIHNYGNLTIQDTVGGGKISYQYTGASLGTTYAANTISTEPGSVLTVKSGTIENLTYDSAVIAYAIDCRTNGGAGDVTVNIDGGTITSLRQAIRIFANSTTNTGTLNISGGEMTGRVIVQNANTSANKAALNITGGTFNANSYKSDVLYVGGSNSATIDINASISGGTFNGEITETHVQDFIFDGTFSSKPKSEYCAEGYTPVKVGDKYSVGVLPDAEVTNLGAITVGPGGYEAKNYYSYDLIYGGGLDSATVPYDLTLAMDFKAKDTEEQAAANKFGGYTTDFFIKMEGMSEGSFVGNGCYLAGYYPSFEAWVKIPLDGFTVENGKVYPVITSAGFDFKYTAICGTVGQFICGIYLTPEVLAANPNLKVNLTLGLSENMEAALNAEFEKVDGYVYDADDLMPVQLPEVEVVDIKGSLKDSDPDLTFALNFKIKDMDSLTDEYLEKLFAKYGNYYTDYVLTISGLSQESVTFNANGGADGYLAGQYDAWSENWVSVPFENVTIQNGQSLYIMEYAAKLMNKQGLRFTLAEVAEIVQNFDCGVYFTPEFLAANPDLKVDLELKVFTEDANGNKVDDISVATNEFDKDDFGVAAVVANGKQTQYFATLAKAIAAADGKTVELLDNVDLGASTIKIPAGMDIALDLNGKVISGVCNTGSGSLIAVPNTAKLTVKDSSNPSTGKITYAQGTSNVGWTIYNEGNLVLESGTIELTGSWSIGYAVDLRPNAWGAAYANASVFEMKGGNIVSSDGGVRVASTSHEGYANVAASFVMNGGKIDAAWDGVFIQQSNDVYDMLSFTMNGGIIESDLNPIRVYGPAPTDYVAGKNSINIALNGGTCTYTSEEARDGWVIPNVLRVGGGNSADIIIDNGGVVVSESFKTTTPVSGYTWVGIADNKYILARVNCKLNIKVINNEPYIGLGINTTVCPVVALKAATNLENPEWTDVTYEAADDDADEYFWVKPTLNGNAYRFFKLAE